MRKVGRPTKYKEEYCDLVIEHMEQGLSVESFAAIVDVSKSTIYEWIKEHPQFSDAVNKGFDKSRLFWERAGLKGMFTESGTTFNATTWIFNMKNRFKDEWRDKQETENNHNITGINLKELVKFTEKDGGDK